MRAGESAEQRRPDRGEVPRHPAGAGLSGAARPHREGHAVPAARRRADRREAHRKLRDVAGRLGLRALFQPPGEPLFRRRQDRARPGRGLCRPQGLDAWPRPSAGSRRSSTTTRRHGAARTRPRRLVAKNKTPEGWPSGVPILGRLTAVVLGENPQRQNAPSRSRRRKRSPRRLRAHSVARSGPPSGLLVGLWTKSSRLGPRRSDKHVAPPDRSGCDRSALSL